MKFYSIKQVAEILGLSQPAIRRYVARRVIPAGRIGKNWRIEESVLREVMRGKQLEGGHIDVDTRPNAEKAADALKAQSGEQAEGGKDSQSADAPQAGEDSGTGKEGTE